MKIHILNISLLLILFSSFKMSSQNTSENWETYLATYDDGITGSVTVRMDLINSAPIKNLNFVVVTGITYSTLRDDGLPEGETFSFLHKIGDDLIQLISDKTKSIISGSFTYNKERLEYFYVKDTVEIQELLEVYYNTNHPNNKYYINITEDKQWEYYTEFLYPNEETLNYLGDQSVLRNLQTSGDDLTKKRRVDHWIYFPTEKDMHNFKEIAINQGFAVENSTIKNELTMPFEIVIWRDDHVDITSIYPITSKLRNLSKKFNGIYDGWETITIPN